MSEGLPEAKADTIEVREVASSARRATSARARNSSTRSSGTATSSTTTGP